MDNVVDVHPVYPTQDLHQQVLQADDRQMTDRQTEADTQKDRKLTDRGRDRHTYTCWQTDG